MMVPVSSIRSPATSVNFVDSRSALLLAWPWTVRALRPLWRTRGGGSWGVGEMGMGVVTGRRNVPKNGHTLKDQKREIIVWCVKLHRDHL